MDSIFFSTLVCFVLGKEERRKERKKKKRGREPPSAGPVIFSFFPFRPRRVSSRFAPFHSSSPASPSPTGASSSLAKTNTPPPPAVCLPIRVDSSRNDRRYSPPAASLAVPMTLSTSSLAGLSRPATAPARHRRDFAPRHPSRPTARSTAANREYLDGIGSVNRKDPGRCWRACHRGPPKRPPACCRSMT